MMTSPASSLAPVWFMDWFGCLLSYNPNDQQLFRSPFAPEDYPDLFALLPFPPKTPARLVLRQKKTMPQGLPAHIELVAAPDEGWTGLRDSERSTYLSINPRNLLMHWNAGALAGWEFFLPLNREMLDGISRLASHELAEVKSDRGEAVPELGMGDVALGAGGIGRFEDFHFSMAASRSVFAAIGRLKPKETGKFTLASVNGKGSLVFSVTPEAPKEA